MLRNKTPWIATVALSLVGCGGMEPLQPDTLDTPPQSTEQRAVSTQAIPIERVPMEFHRRAAQLLEDVRGTDSAPTWEAATLAPTVQPLYRPDVQGVAYYEFRVLVRQQPMGFIVVSAGSHDHPIPHWNFEGRSPTETLILQGGSAATAFYKVDALSYVAEGSGGQLLAKLGDLPNRIVGQTPGSLDTPFTPTDVTWAPAVAIADDSQATAVVHRKQASGPTVPTAPIDLTGWQSWQELKTNFRSSYATLAESLKREAAEEWETEILARDEGEGLVIDEPHEVALLYPGATYQLSGDGAAVVRPELVTNASGGQKLVLTAVLTRLGTGLPLTVEIAYANGYVETLPFVVLAPEEVDTTGDVPPQLQGSKSEDSESSYWADMGKTAWGPWTEYYAGTHANQRLYNQMASGSGPNTSSCASGCGATAWAMLLGWGDLQASLGNPTWTKRWGLYRVNGGYGSNAVAPLTMDTGVRNMTWEVRNHINTFCTASGNGATSPWRMDEVSGYLKNRSGARVSTHYNILGIHEKRLRDKVIDSIKNRKVPAIIGTGWLSHYPLAYGYRSRSRVVKKCFIVCWKKTEVQRSFYVNQGWGGAQNGWLNASTWFAGQLFPN